MTESIFNKIALIIAVFSLFLTLYTNQVFHGGVWGKLHNLSMKPNIVISDVSYLEKEGLQFSLFRDQGIDTYGAFITRISIKDGNGRLVKELDQQALSEINTSDIHNYYIAKVEPGKKSLIIPLGAKAQLTLPIKLANEDEHVIEVEDISGKVWSLKFAVSS